MLKEAAQSLMQKVLPQPTRADRLTTLRAAIRDAQRLGITSVQNAGGSPDDLALFDELRAAGELQVRVQLSPSRQKRLTPIARRSRLPVSST